MKNKSYLNNHRKKSFASLVLAFLLMLTFNASPMILLSDAIRARTANAYKTTQTQTYYSNSTNESETKFADAQLPSSLKKYFEGSEKNFNIYTYYINNYDEILKDRADKFFDAYDFADYHASYVAFLSYFGSENLSDFYEKQKDSQILKLKLETVSFKNLVEYLGIKGLENYDDVQEKSLPAISDITGEAVRDFPYRNLSNFYRMFANYTIYGDINYIPADEDESPNKDITTIEAFYNSNTHYLRLKEYIDNEIVKNAPTYTFDGKTQDTTVASIFAKDAPLTVDYNYVTNTYTKYSVPNVPYRTNTVSENTQNTIYYFGSETEIASSSAYINNKDFFTIKAKGEKENDDMLYYRLIQSGETGYIDKEHPTYYRFTSKPYVSTSSYYNVYVLNNNPSQSELDTYSSIYFKTMTASEYNAEKDYYLNIPYEKDELYFKAVYGNLLYSKDGFTFDDFVDYFTTKLDDSSRTSKLYLKFTANEKKEVFISSEKYDEFKAAYPKYAYNLTSVSMSAEAMSKDNDYEKIVKNSSNSSYFIDGYDLYFEKEKQYYTETAPSTYDESNFETTYSPIVNLEQENVPLKNYEMDETTYSRKLFVLSDEATVEINGTTYTGVSQNVIDENSKYYVAAPSFVYSNNNIDSNTYKLFYKHTATTANKLYIVDDSDNASNNNIYNTLNFNVIKSSELKNNYTNYLAVSESDSNYNKNFQLYYKYTRSVDTTRGFYILTDSLSESDVDYIKRSLTYKTVGSGELTDYVLIENNEENKSIYDTAKVGPLATANLKIYYKLSNVFVQNDLKNGNAVYIVDSSLSTSDKEEYSKNMYTAISQKEIDNNPGLYVLIDSNDPNYSAKDDVKLYYKYVQSSTPTKRVYSIDDIDSTASGFESNAYKLISAGEEGYVKGAELYYKKNLIKENTTNITKNTYYYYQTQSSVTLSANSYYAISFYVQTIGENARASFGIKDTANMLTDIDLSNINTEGKWQQYYIFISTNISTASTINLYLYLGDKVNGIKGNTSASSITGAVFFDDIKITKIGLTDFNKKAIDDKPVYSEEKLVKDGEVELSGQYADDYNNRVFVANLDSRFETNQYDFRNYIDGTIDVFGSDWNSMFDFDNSSLQEFLGKNTGVEEEKVNNKLNNPSLINDNIDGYNMYDSSFTSLWRYYISRDLKNEFSIAKYRKAYLDGKLDVSTTNQIEEPEKDEEAEKKKEEEDKDKSEEEKAEDKLDIKYISSPFGNNNYALRLKNSSKDIGLGITSNSFTVKQFEYYKISLWIYSPDLDGKATISVNSVISDRQSPTYGSLLSASVSSTYANVSKSASSSSEYGWIPVSLYIEGNNFKDMECYLVLTAESDCTVYFDNIRIEKTTSSLYDNASSNSSSEKYTAALSLTPSTSINSSDIKNGTFDYIKETSTEHSVTSDVPYAADNWTGMTGNSSKVVAGIVSTQQNAFFNKYSSDTNKIPYEGSDTYSNVFAIYSPATVKALDETTDVSVNHNYSIYSSSLSLSSNSIYKITFKFYKTENFKGTLISNIYGSSVKTANIIASLEIPSTEIESGWQTFTYYVATTTSSQSVYLEIGVKNATDLCFFKSVASKKLSNKTMNEIIAEVAKEKGISNATTDSLYYSIKDVRFLDMADTNFSHHSTVENNETNLFDPKNFTDKTETNNDHTSGKNGVIVASYFDTVSTTTHSVTINKVTYYIGEVYTATIEGAEYYVHKTYDSTTNKFGYKLYSDKELKNKVNKIGENDVTISTGDVKIMIGELDIPTTTTYRLFKFKDLREEVTTISGSAVSVPNLDKVIVGTGSKATENTITSTQNNSYIYNFGTSTKKDYEINNTIISADELKNAQSGNVLILSNSYSTDYITLTQSNSRTIGKSTYNVLRIYVKTSNFEKANFGLNIEIEAVNVKWTNINTTTSTKADEYGFVCYEVLIKTNSNDSISNFEVKLSLGDETNTGAGYAIISKVSLESLADADTFNHYSELVGDDNENIKKAIYENTSTDEDGDDDADDKNPVSWATFFYIFSSILLVVTMVVAMVALILKKHPIKSLQKYENEHERDIETTKTKNVNKKSPNARNKDEIIIDANPNEKSNNKNSGGIE